MKVLVISLGCKVNQSEGEDILNRFAAAGFKQAGPAEPADIIIVNTCTVTREADRKSRQLIYQAVKKKAGLATIVAVTGCYAEVATDKLREIPGVDVVVAQHDKEQVFDKVVTSLGRHAPSLAAEPTSREGRGRTRAFLKIQDGCDNRCAYCVVPDARGKSRSLSEDEILCKAAGLAAGGTREIVLTGINVGKFSADEITPTQSEGASHLPDRLAAGRRGKAGNDNLAHLIKRLLNTPGLARIRLSSIEPEDVTEELVETLKKSGARNPNSRVLANSEKQLKGKRQQVYLCPHLHIPLQSGDDKTLKRMKRRYTADEYLKIVERVRAACPDVAITTDVIVGFPGETDEEFRNTYRFIEKAGFAKLHVFRYSKRVGTPAAVTSGQIPAAIKTERSEALRELSGRLEAAYRSKFTGRELDVLVEKASGRRLTGTSENYLTVTFEGEPSLRGQIVRTKLDG